MVVLLSWALSLYPSRSDDRCSRKARTQAYAVSSPSFLLSIATIGIFDTCALFAGFNPIASYTENVAIDYMNWRLYARRAGTKNTL